MSVTDRIKTAEDRFAEAVVRAHVTSQALRFARVTAVAFAAQFALIGSGRLGWEAVASLLTGAVETAVRQLYPAVPIGKVAEAARVFGVAEPAAPAVPATK